MLGHALDVARMKHGFPKRKGQARPVFQCEVAFGFGKLMLDLQIAQVHATAEEDRDQDADREKQEAAGTPMHTIP